MEKYYNESKREKRYVSMKKKSPEKNELVISLAFLSSVKIALSITFQNVKL